MKRSNALIIAAALVSMVVPAAPALGDDEHTEINFAINGGYDYQFSADTDNDGSFSVSRFNAGLAMKTDFSSQLHLALRFNVGVDQYNFSGQPFGPAVGGDPWDGIYRVGAGALFTFDIDKKWSIFGGPLIEFDGESGADWGDSFIGGGVVGVTYSYSEKLTVGGGVWIASQIEDNVRFFPVLIVDWKFADNFRLSTQASPYTIGRTVLELVWEPLEDWQFAIGGARAFSRFRLNDSGPAPNGVGQDQSIPFWLRVGWQPNPHIHLDAVVGANTSGELRLDNSHGDNIAHTDYNAALFAGLYVKVAF